MTDQQQEFARLFITFEGGEGTGKTTQIAMLSEYLRQQNADLLVTREPGGCHEAEALRNIFQHRHDLKWEPISRALIVTAARAEHVIKVINPALQDNKTILCDRFFDSTLAYQGYGMGVSLDVLKAIHKDALDNIEPDVTFILDMDVKKAMDRASRRGEADAIEAMDISFHEKLRMGYQAIAKENPKRVYMINADDTAEAVHDKVVIALNDYMDTLT